MNGTEVNNNGTPTSTSISASKENIVEVKATTWSKDSYGLYDYESSEDNKQEKFICDESMKIFRKDFFVFHATVSQPLYSKPAGKAETILHIINDREGAPDTFHVVPGPLTAPQSAMTEPMPANDVYLIVKTLKEEFTEEPCGFDMAPGLNFKLGKVEFRVLETRDEAGTVRHSSTVPNMAPAKRVERKGSKEEGDLNTEHLGLCRICLTDSADDLLYAPCTCKGSAELVHVQCLKGWFQSKTTNKLWGPNTVHYTINNIKCEVCKQEIEPIFISEGKSYELFNLERPEWPYMIVEQMEKEGNSRVYFLLSFIQTEDITCGRGHNCDVRLVDISVSRVHAIIKFIAAENRFVLYDKASKFGTLVLLDKELKLTQRKVGFQVGKTVMICSVKKKGPKVGINLPGLVPSETLIESPLQQPALPTLPPASLQGKFMYAGKK